MTTREDIALALIDPNAKPWEFPDPKLPDDPFARAALTARKAGPQNYPEGKIGALAEFLAPSTPLDYASMFAFGPAGRALGKGVQLGSLVGGAMLTGDEAQGGVLDKAAKVIRKAPVVISRANPDENDIRAIQEAAFAYGKKGWPTAEREVFKTTPEAYAETTKLVPQVSIRDKLPGPVEGGKLPLGGRVAPVIENQEEIANRVAERLYPMVKRGDETLKFYHTGPVIRGLERNADMSVPEANQFLRNWSGQGAATSPRTSTPPNLRNSSFLSYERARGEPMTIERFRDVGNTPGYGMMGMHVNLGDQFARGTVNPWQNPKPYTFRENWSGNLRDVTTDTHNIRSTLYELDQIKPGSLPRGWFVSDDAFKRYKDDGFKSLKPGDISDELTGQAVKKIYRQSEYLPMTAPWYRAAEKVGIAPAEAQSGGWFSYGPITGLKSPPKTIVNLLNDQVEATAKVLDVPSEKIVDWWARGKIPLAGIGGVGVMGGIADQSRYGER